jgi:hypothetical protein
MFQLWASAGALAIGAARHVVASNTLRKNKRTAAPQIIDILGFLAADGPIGAAKVPYSVMPLS